MNKLGIYIRSILLPVLGGAIVGIITSQSIDYNALKQPPLAPPSALFPIVWTILYILMGVSYGILKSKEQTDKDVDLIYYGQLIVNYLWSFIFFVFKWRFLAILWIILLAVLVVIMITRFYGKDKTAGLLQIPYLLWVLFATYLTIGVYVLNV